MDKDDERYMLCGLEKLYEKGGFIRDCVTESFKEQIPAYVVDLIFSYYKGGPGFWKIVQKTLAVYEDMAETADYGYDGEEYIPLFDEDYYNWILDRTVYFEVKKARSENLPAKRRADYWNSDEFTSRQKQFLRNLSAFEDELFKYAFGLDGCKRMSIQEIAALNEFSCPSDYLESLVGWGAQKLNKEVL